MTDNDNIIIEQLFSEARKTEIEDNGFSHRVMRSLPDTIARVSRHTIIISRLWTFFCVAIGLAFSFAFHFWELAATYIEVFVRTLPTYDTPGICYAPMTIVMVVASAFGIYKWVDTGRMPV